LRFAANEALISVNDRLLGSNSQESFDEIKGDIEVFAQQLFGSSDVSLWRNSDPRERLHVRMKTSAAVDLKATMKNLQRL
jgi:hypothetical protein